MGTEHRERERERERDRDRDIGGDKDCLFLAPFSLSPRCGTKNRKVFSPPLVAPGAVRSVPALAYHEPLAGHTRPRACGEI